MLQFNPQQLLAQFERVAMVSRPAEFYCTKVTKTSGFDPESVLKAMRAMVVEAMKSQKLIQLQNSTSDLIQQRANAQVAEVHVFKAKIELALMKPEVALDTIEAGYRQRAEPLELLRDVQQLVMGVVKSARQPIVVRKPKQDIYTKLYTTNPVEMKEIADLIAYLSGGPLIPQKLAPPPKPTKVVQRPQINSQNEKKLVQRPDKSKAESADLGVKYKQFARQDSVQHYPINESKQAGAKQPEKKAEPANQPSEKLMEYIRQKNLVRRPFVQQKQDSDAELTKQVNEKPDAKQMTFSQYEKTQITLKPKADPSYDQTQVTLKPKAEPLSQKQVQIQKKTQEDIDDIIAEAQQLVKQMAEEDVVIPQPKQRAELKPEVDLDDIFDSGLRNQLDDLVKSQVVVEHKKTAPLEQYEEINLRPDDAVEIQLDSPKLVPQQADVELGDTTKMTEADFDQTATADFDDTIQRTHGAGDFDEQEEEYKEELIKSLNTMKSQNQNINLDYENVFDAVEKPDYL